MKKKPYLKSLVLNLVAVTYLLGLTLTGYGQSVQKNATAIPSGPEATSLRTATAKHFVNTNGGLTAIIGSRPMHYEEAPGVWKDIDLNTVKSPSRGFVRENTANSIKSFYPQLGDQSIGIQIANVQGKISIGSKLKVLHYDADGTPSLVEHARRTHPSSASNQVLYSNLFSNADLEYLIGVGRIKSNLILKSLPPSMKGGLGYFGFSETLVLPTGWILKTVESIVNSNTSTRFPIQILNEVGDIVYVIPIPDVYEKNDPSTSLHPDGDWPIAYKINKQGSTYELITMVPLNWMTASDRDYPLVIDPTVVELGNYGGWQDNVSYFDSSPSGYVFTGFYTGTDHRAYAKFNTASIPDNAEIQDVQVRLYQNGQDDLNPQTIVINDVTGAPAPYFASNTAAYTDFGNGPYTTFTATNTGFYGPFDLGASADTNLQNRLGLDWFQIALYNAGTFKRFTSDTSQLIVVYDTCIIASYTSVDVQCATDSNGTATVSIDSLIAPPYTFVWSTTPVQTNATATGLTVGTYQVTTTDSAGCSSSKSIDITQLFTSVISSSTDVTCNGDSTGSAVVVASGGGSPYTYQWDDPANQTTATANSLPAGIYEVRIMDATGCIDSSEVEIIEPAALTLTTLVTDNTCATASNGSASVIVIGGTPGYAYVWSDPSSQTTTTATGLPAGLYKVVVTDTLGCQDSVVTVVGNPPPNDVGVISIDAPVSGCGLTSTESVTITLVNFGANLQTAIPVMYQVNGGPIVTEMVTGNILSCDTITYTFTATSNMSVVGSYFIDSWTTLSGDGNLLNDSVRFVLVTNNPIVSALPYIENFEGETTCSDICGAACLLSGPWTNNATVDDIDWTVDRGGTSSLSTGPAVDHTLGTNFGKYIYTEASGCINSKALIIGPCIDLSSASNPYLDFWYHMYGATMGKLAIDIYSGGVWNIGVDSLIGEQGNAWRYRDIDLGSFSGIIRIRFRGVTGSSFTSDMALDDIRVYDKPPEDIGVIRFDSPASGCALDTNEVVTILVQNFGINTQDTLFLFYQINGGPIVSESLVGTFLPGDTILYTFLDSADLSAIGAYNFDAWANVTGDGDSSNDSTLGYSVNNLLNVSAFPYSENFESGQNGWISGGTNSSWAFGLPQKFVIDTAASGVNAWVTGGLGLGTYNNNENSYVLSPCFDFSSLTSPVIKMNIWWNSEFSQDGASLQSSIDNGLTWQDVGSFGDPNNWFTDNSITALGPSGSQMGWTGRISTSNGSVDWVQASRSLTDLAGQPTVIFRMNFGSDGSIADDGFGFDDVEILDVLHCLNGILDSDEVAIDCGGTDCQPCYCLSAYSNTADEWISDVTFNTISNPSASTNYSDFTNLSTTVVIGNMYTITVEPSINGPWNEHIWAWVDWNQNNDFSDPGEAYDLDSISGTCIPCATLTANITVPGGALTGPTRMRIVMEFSTDPFPCGGGTYGETEDYTVIITDNCATLTGSGSDALCFNDSSGLASVSISGGNAPFTYLWDDPSAQTDSIASGLTAGSYQVLVTDSLGCVDSTSVTIGEPTPLIVNLVDSGNISCFGLSDGFAVVGATGGITPYAYNWIGPGTLNDSVMNLPTGTYTNEVTDSNGCMTDLTVFLSEPSLLTIVTTQTNETCSGNCDGAIEAVGSGGTPGYNFIWSTASILNAEFGLCPASYWINVTDVNGCSAQDTVDILGSTGAIVADAGPDLSVCLGDSIQIGGSPTSSDTSAIILWSPNDSINSVSASNPMVYPSVNTTYTVEVFAGGISFILTDMFDYGEDLLSHAYTDSGDVLLGAYTCNTGLDSTMRIGACTGVAGSWVEFTASVKTGTDSLQLAFVVPWVGTGGVSIYVDGGLKGTIQAPITTVCDRVLLTMGNMTPFTGDGQVIIRIQDNLNSCDGDGQIESVKVYSKNTCSSVDQAEILIDPVYATAVDDSICAGDSIFLGGAYQFGAGSYVDNLSSVLGCDSIITTTLSIISNIASYDTVAICSGDSAFLGGAYQTIAGPYVDMYASINGCDSTVTTELVFVSVITKNLQDTICDGDSILLSGAYQFTVGTYVDSFIASGGCDSLVLTALVVNPIFNILDTIAICDNDSVFLEGSFQTSAGIYIDTLPSQFGCDSVVSTTLVVNPTYATSGSATICANDSIFLGGAYQNTAGFYTDTLSSIDGCDSVVLTTLAVNPVFAIPASAIICNGDSILIGGIYRTTAGTYDDSLSTVDGCDSVISTTLTVNPSYFSNPTISICNGDSALIAGTWYTAAGSHADSLLSVDGCDSVTTTLLIVNPTYAINDTTAICFGDSILLGGSFQTTSGSYVDSYTTSSGCDSTVTTFLGIGTPIVLTVSSFDALCDSSCDGTAQLATTGGVGTLIFSWNTSPVQTGDTAFGLCAGTYIVTVTDGIGCQVQDSATVASPPPLTLIVTTINNPTCFGLCDGSITTSVSGGISPITYLWNDPSAQTTANALNLCAGTYTLSATDSNGCVGVVSATITDPTPLVVTVTGIDSICTGTCTGTAVASVTGGTVPITYTWSNGPSGSSLSALCIGTYTVTVEDSLACQSDDSITVSNFPIENALFSYPQASYCQNGNGPMPTITGDGGGTFSSGPNLSINAFTGQLLPDSSLPGTYNVVYTTGGPCPDTDTVQVDIVSVPTVNITNIPPICGSDSTNTSLTAAPSGGTWSGAGIIDSINGIFSPTSVGPGLHMVTYSYSNGSCSNTDNTIIKILPLPSISISGSDTICEGGTAVFQISILGLGPFDITYSDGTNTFPLSNLYNGDTMSFSPTVTTTYTLLSLNDSAGCSGVVGGSRTIYVIDAPPLPIVTSPVPHCEGDPIPQLTALPQVGGNMSWYDDTLNNPVATGNTYTPFGLNPGSNFFYVSEFITGCSSYASEVEVISFTQGSIDAGNDVKTCLGTAVTLQATGGSSYAWYPSKGLSDSTIANPDANPNATTMYYVIATVNDSCQYVDSVRVTVDNTPSCGWYIYNGFTPNNDGDNDEWIIDGIEGFPDNEISIFNRWEDIVQSFKGYNNTSVVWNGDNESGQALPEGTYFYIILTGDDKYSGWVQITR